MLQVLEAKEKTATPIKGALAKVKPSLAIEPANVAVDNVISLNG